MNLIRQLVERCVLILVLSTWAQFALCGETMVVGIDRKFAFDDAGHRQAFEPEQDEVFDTVMISTVKRWIKKGLIT